MVRKEPTGEEIRIEDEGEATQRLREGNEGQVQTGDVSDIARASWYIGKEITQQRPTQKRKITDYFSKSSTKK